MYVNLDHVDYPDYKTVIKMDTDANSKTFGELRVVSDAVDISVDRFEEFREEMREEMRRLKEQPKMFRLNCQNCGGPLVQELDNHLVKCPYCRSSYFIGTNLVYSVE